MRLLIIIIVAGLLLSVLKSVIIVLALLLAVSFIWALIAQPLEFVPAEPFAEFLARLKQLIQEKEVELILVGMPRNMDGTYGPAATRVQEFVSELKKAIPLRIKKWDERLTTAQANRILLDANVRRDKRKEKVDQMAAAILLQSYLDTLHATDLTTDEHG